MIYPNNDLWSVRQIEFLHDALKGYTGGGNASFTLTKK